MMNYRIIVTNNATVVMNIATTMKNAPVTKGISRV
jgi:hypothetical protein